VSRLTADNIIQNSATTTTTDATAGPLPLPGPQIAAAPENGRALDACRTSDPWPSAQHPSTSPRPRRRRPRSCRTGQTMPSILSSSRRLTHRLRAASARKVLGEAQWRAPSGPGQAAVVADRLGRAGGEGRQAGGGVPRVGGGGGGGRQAGAHKEQTVHALGTSACQNAVFKGCCEVCIRYWACVNTCQVADKLALLTCARTWSNAR
jgi:hypothetical protein